MISKKELRDAVEAQAALLGEFSKQIDAVSKAAKNRVEKVERELRVLRNCPLDPPKEGDVYWLSPASHARDVEYQMYWRGGYRNGRKLTGCQG